MTPPNFSQIWTIKCTFDVKNVFFMKINVNIEFSNQNPLKSNHWNIIFLYLYFRKNINLGSLYLKISYRCDARCSFASFSLKFSHFLKISVEFGQNASIILKIDTVSTQSTNCNSEKIRPIPPRTNRHGVSYQLHSRPWRHHHSTHFHHY